jgi:hypothetical protein
LQRVINKNGGPEAVFKSATSGTKEGATTLGKVMDSLGPDERKTVTAAVLNKLGKATAGNQNAAGDEFSMSTFLTNWNNLSKPARSVLFDGYGPKFAENMDRIARVASNIRTGSKYLSNPSGSAITGAQLGTVGALTMSILSGNIGTAGAIAGGLATANLTAKALTNPRFVSWLAQQTKVPVQNVPAQVAVLKQVADRQKDPTLSEVADVIGQSYNAQKQQAQQ